MSYRVKEMFHTLQGEGANTGRPAVFVRFTGCNLWSGREADRARAVCRFCDTDFVGTDGRGGAVYPSAAAVAEIAACTWEHAHAEGPIGVREIVRTDAWPSNPFCVLTGGEPLLQVDGALVDALHDAGFEIAVETNGTIGAPEGLDWVCVSPKAGANLVQRAGDELKLVYPQAGIEPDDCAALDFNHFFLQPMDGPNRSRHTRAAAEYCAQHPQWQLSLQTHKLLGIP